jgi:hypothetical protein
MSISSMVDLGMRRQHQISNPREVQEAGVPEADSAPEAGQNGVQAALSKLTAFVPSEVVGLYISGLGILTPTTYTAKWAIFAICLVLIPVFIGLNYLIQKKQAGKEAPAASTWFFILLFALVAFVAWSAAIPDTPFLYFSDRATIIAGFLVLVLAAVMYKAADLLGIVPKSP